MNTDTETENQTHPAGPCLLVIFGASGDLTKRKLIPALANLVVSRLLPEEFAVVGMASREWSDNDFRQAMREGMDEFATGNISADVVEWIVQRLHYVGGDFNDPEAFNGLKTKLAEVDGQFKTGGNYLYYLATAPKFFASVPKQLGNVGLTSQGADAWRRVIVEKPFGTDLESARQLNRDLWQVLDESRIFRIDHYLGKETVQNILAFRFANGIYEPIWNRRYIDCVQITAAETIGVEDRGPYYEGAGALRDMVPNHLFQLLTLTAMEPPVSFEAEAVHNKQVEILKSINHYGPEDVVRNAVRGQYGPGPGHDGENEQPGYRSESRVAPDSTTPTFAALKLKIENWRWAGVPFYLRTGKCLAKRCTEVAIRFKSVPWLMFRETPVERVSQNWLVIRIQPTESISMSFNAKIPGAGMQLGKVNMDFCYKDYFGSKPETGYERLLYDCMLGDRTLFQRSDMVETSWCVVQPVLDYWHSNAPNDFPNYTAGSWGPPDADRLIENDGQYWKNSD